jgi:hypothetical protein
MFGGGHTPGEARAHENYRQSKKLFQAGQRQAINKAFAQAGGALKGGYGQALGAIGQMGQAQRQQILQSQQQQIAQLNQNMASRGLYNTTIGAGAGQQFQNVRQNTQIALGNLQSQLAGLRANIFTQRGRGLSGLALGKLGAQTQRKMTLTGIRGALGGPPQQVPEEFNYGGLSNLIFGQEATNQFAQGGLAGLFGSSTASPGYTNLAPGTTSSIPQGPPLPIQTSGTYGPPAP